MLRATTVAHRAASVLRRVSPAVVAIALATTATVAVTQPAAAAYAPKVVIVVGPSGGATARYLDRARSYASQARAYGASVSEIYTPRATWTRVLAAAQGANVFIYLGHGNGWPSPYPPYQGLTKDGLGLNPTEKSGNARTKYYGEDLVAAQLRFAPGAIVLFNHLCYASGNGEPGSREPSWATARKRVDNFAAGFLRAGAAAVLADAHSSLKYELAFLFGRSRSVLDAWRADPDARGHERSFASVRTPGFTTYLDPDTTKAGFYRSLVTKPGVATGRIFTAPLSARTTTDVALRAGEGTASRKLAVVPDGARVWVTGSLVHDDAGRTWAPVITGLGQTGFVAAWHASFAGTARARTNLILRSRPTTASAARLTLRKGTRVTVTGSRTDSRERVWLSVRTAAGKTGWVAAWLTRP